MRGRGIYAETGKWKSEGYEDQKTMAEYTTRTSKHDQVNRAEGK